MFGNVAFSQSSFSELTKRNTLLASASISAAVSTSCDAKFTASGAGSTACTTTTSSSCIRARTVTLLADIQVSGTATLVVDPVTVVDASASSSITSSATIIGRYTVSGSASTAITTTTSLTPSRVMRFDGIKVILGTSATVAIAREKWENIENDDTFWVDITNDTNMWVDITNDSNTWTKVA